MTVPWVFQQTLGRENGLTPMYAQTFCLASGRDSAILES